MALQAYLKLKGAKMGEIKGSVSQKGREGRIAVLGSSHAVASLEAGGPVQHQPYELIKPVDKATVPLHQALVTGEVFSECEIQYWTPSLGGSTGAGVETQHYAVRLTNARLLDIDFEQPLTLDPDLRSWPEIETLRLVYDEIEWRWTNPAQSFSANAKPKTKPKTKAAPRKKKA
jgi:type VI secretion system secreted protein Hcp